MKMTLLEMTQNILSALGSDAVNSISDTQEAYDVSLVIKETYDELFANEDVPEHKTLIQLEGLADLSKPNYLKIPENVNNISWIKYRNLVNGQYTDVTPLTKEKFLDIILGQGKTRATEVTDFSGATFLIETNKHPSYWTTFDDKHIIFDSWNQDVENTVHQNNTLAWGSVGANWVHNDSFVPKLDANLFPFLLSESKAVAFINIKGVSSAKEEQKSRRQRIKFQKRKYRYAPGIRTDFARKR